jgi:carboxymethylenebutenolidase
MLILRGVAGPMEGYKQIAETVSSWGFHALVHDWQVRGNEPDDADLESDLSQAFKYIESRPDVHAERIGLMGFCKGGTFAFIAARKRPGLIGIAIFHGFCRRNASENHLQQPCDLAPGMQAPMLLLHGTEDSQAPIEGMRRLLSRLQLSGVVSSLHEYPGVEHGFAVSTHPGYEPKAALDSLRRAEAFFFRADHSHVRRTPSISE